MFFVDPKLWQFSWGCLRPDRPAILPAMFVGLAQSQRTMKTSSQLLKGYVIYMYRIFYNYINIYIPYNYYIYIIIIFNNNNNYYIYIYIYYYHLLLLFFLFLLLL